MNGSRHDEGWARIEEVFSRAQELPASERLGYVEEACADEPELKEEVLALLESADSSEDYLADLAARVGAPKSPKSQLGELAGKRLGRWRLVELIGRGGMGVVYLAERDDEQFRMKAALKILPLGVRSDEQKERFLAERQILAGLDHPNIAHILDGGVAEDGTPFYVMEHVAGLPIDKYCDDRGLSIDERLRLFEDVCEAVQHAHRKLIVHRDLKPSNILVTPEGLVKLLDFGIARMLGPESGEDQQATNVGARAMTLPYASPEQVRGEAVTTASDVYSLGLVLYELLSGNHPYRHKITSPFVAAQIITETSPPSLSEITGAFGPKGGDDSPEWTSAEVAAAQRGTTVGRLNRTLAGDLDTIVMMSIRKEPDRRYPSVLSLAEDLRNYRRKFPVSARPDTLPYRLSRFVQRNRLATAIGSLAAVLGVVLVVSSLSAAAREKEQSQVIRREAATAEAVTEFLVGLFEFTEVPDGFADTIRARTLLDRGSSRITESLEGQPEVKVRLLRTLADVYANLGLYDEAVPALEEAIEIRRNLLPGDELALAQDLLELAQSRRLSRNFELAEPHFREALQIFRRRPGDSIDLGRTLAGFATNHALLGKTDSALILNEEAIDVNRRVRGEGAVFTLQTLQDRGVIFRAAEQADSSEAAYRRVLPLLKEKGDSARLLYAATLNNLGYLLKTQGDFQGAEAVYREGLTIEQEINLPIRLLTLLSNLATVEDDLGNLEETESLLLERVRVAEKAWPGGHWRVGSAAGALVEFFVRYRQPGKALPHAHQQLSSYEATLGPGHGWTAGAQALVGVCLLDMDRFAEAEPYLLESHERLAGLLGPEHAQVQSMVLRLVNLYERWDRPARAEHFRSMLVNRSAGGT